MESPGEYLKREREHRGISLEDIFKETRVPLKHLEALEADNYDAMPHPTFTKGYIRSYCKVLGVDETDAVLRYEIYLKDKAASAENVKAAPRPPRPRKIQRPPLLGQFWGDKRNVIMVAVGSAAVVVIIVAYLIFGSMDRAPEPVPVDEQTVEEAAPSALDAAPSEKEPVPEASPPAPPKAVEKVIVPVKAVQEAPMRHSLAVKATESVWIQVVIDGAPPFDVTLNKGETVVWKAAEALTLKIGNAGGVELTFNGKQMAPVGESGYVVRLDLPGGKVRVLARPKPEEEPADKPAEPAEEGPEVKTPAGAAGTKPEVKTPAGAAGTKPEVKTPAGAAGTMPVITPPVPAAGTMPVITPPAGVTGTKPEVKTPEVKTAPQVEERDEADVDADVPPAP